MDKQTNWSRPFNKQGQKKEGAADNDSVRKIKKPWFANTNRMAAAGVLKIPQTQMHQGG